MKWKKDEAKQRPRLMSDDGEEIKEEDDMFDDVIESTGSPDELVELSQTPEGIDGPSRRPDDLVEHTPQDEMCAAGIDGALCLTYEEELNCSDNAMASSEKEHTKVT